LFLARKGYRVLLVDRAKFPSDVVNGYYIQQHGAARLEHWGLLDRVRASNCPPLYRITFDLGEFSLSGSPPPADGIAEGYAPRRTVLGKMLVDAATEAGAELRENFPVHQLLRDGEHVTGIRGYTTTGTAVTELGRIVIGADGVNSVVARAVKRRNLQCSASAHLLVRCPLERCSDRRRGVLSAKSPYDCWQLYKRRSDCRAHELPP